jgi:hypothetical protein
MKPLVMIPLCLLACALLSCDIFLGDVGKLDGPCADNGACDDGLRCIDDICEDVPKLGQECNPYDDRDFACDEGLYCITMNDEATCSGLPADGEPCICHWFGNGVLVYCDDDDSSDVEGGNTACGFGMSCADGICTDYVGK